jgi:hypothetical protein
MIKLRKIRLAGNITGMGKEEEEEKNAYALLV